MTTQTKLDAAREKLALAGNDAHIRCLQLQGARVLKEEIYFRLISTLPSCMDLNRSNQSANVFHQVNGSQGAPFAAITAMLAAMEADPFFADAEKQVAPILAEIEELEAALIEEGHQAAVAREAREAKLEALKAEAIAEVEKRFAESPAPTKAKSNS